MRVLGVFAVFFVFDNADDVFAVSDGALQSFHREGGNYLNSTGDHSDDAHDDEAGGIDIIRCENEVWADNELDCREHEHKLPAEIFIGAVAIGVEHAEHTVEGGETAGHQIESFIDEAFVGE